MRAAALEKRECPAEQKRDCKGEDSDQKFHIGGQRPKSGRRSVRARLVKLLGMAVVMVASHRLFDSSRGRTGYDRQRPAVERRHESGRRYKPHGEDRQQRQDEQPFSGANHGFADSTNPFDVVHLTRMAFPNL